VGDEKGRCTGWCVAALAWWCNELVVMKREMRHIEKEGYRETMRERERGIQRVFVKDKRLCRNVFFNQRKTSPFLHKTIVVINEATVF
jgi:hypothetical protein